MTAPGQAAQYVLYSLAIGAMLGAVYGFLRPLRAGATALADGLFVIAAFCGWGYLCFGICRCDIRLGYTAALLLGGVIWEMTIGRLLRPFFRLVWQVIGWPWKKIFGFSRKIYKFLLAILKKWVTIERTIEKEGDVTRGKKKKGKTGHAQNQPRHKSRHFGRRRPVRGGTGGAV